MLQSESDQLGGVAQWMRREAYRNEVRAVEARTAIENALRALQIGEPELAKRILAEALRRC